jgi:hypothetical protein
MSGRQLSLAAELPPSVLLGAAADAAGRTSRYADLKNAIKAFVLVEVNQGNAATVAVSILQAKDTSGTGSKAVNAVPIFLQNNALVTDVQAQQTAAASFTTDATLQDKLLLFEILPEAALDLANGFETIAVQTGASNAANITRAELIVYAQTKALGASQPSTYTE